MAAPNVHPSSNDKEMQFRAAAAKALDIKSCQDLQTPEFNPYDIPATAAHFAQKLRGCIATFDAVFNTCEPYKISIERLASELEECTDVV